MNFFSVVQNALQRMDYLLMFIFIKFLRRVIERFFSSNDILFISLTLSVITNVIGLHELSSSNALSTQKWIFGRGIKTVESIMVFISALHRASSLLLVDMLMSSLRTVKPEDTDTHQSFMYFIVATCSVIIIPVVTHKFENDETGNHISRLVFVMYAENSAFLTQDMEINQIAPFMAVVMLCCVKYYISDILGVTFLKILHAVNMLLTNVIVSTLMSSNKLLAADSDGETVWIITILMIADHIQQLFPGIQDVRDYAIWKSAQLLSLNFIARGIDTESICLVLFLILVLVSFLVYISQWRDYVLRCSAITELVLLVLVNTFFEVAKSFMMGIPHSLVFVFLLSLLCVVHIALEGV